MTFKFLTFQGNGKNKKKKIQYSDNIEKNTQKMKKYKNDKDEKALIVYCKNKMSKKAKATEKNKQKL